MLMIELIDQFSNYALNHDDICCANCNHIVECGRENDSDMMKFCCFCNQFDPNMDRVIENRDN